jgi:CDP-diacylglycerol---glycerol-3-phosphate 3-phosphatidyltransferase
MANYDLLNTLALVVTLIMVTLAYGVRLVLRGRAHFDRVERQGGSVLLGKGMMEMAYWSLQPVARFLVFCGVSPNQLSWTSLVLGGVAGVCLAYGHFGYAAVFATQSAFLDTLDGMVARLTGQASDAGEVLDAAVDRYVEFFFLACLVIYYREIPIFQIIALMALMGSFMVSYSTAKAEALHLDPPSGIMRRPERAFYLVVGAALSPLPLPWLSSLETFSTPVGYPLLGAVALVALLANISAIERFWTIALAIREREAEVLAAESGEKACEPRPRPHLDHGRAWTVPAQKSDFR